MDANDAIRSRRPPRELFALTHAATTVLLASWLLGGMGARGEWLVALIASPAWLVLALEARDRMRLRDRGGLLRMARWAAPLLALGGFAILSALNPSHAVGLLGGVEVLRPIPHLEWLPASANPTGSLRIFACLGGLACVGLNLAFCVQSRRSLRLLVLTLSIHALFLAVVGTLQRQGGADGPWFGRAAAVNEAWFSTFLYHNHWGAFAVLHVAATFAGIFHALRHPEIRGWHHTPGPLLALTALLIAATAPLSTSRSATLLMAVLCAAAAVSALLHARRRARRSGRAPSRWIPGLTGLFIAGGGLLVFQQSGDILSARAAKTIDQVTAIKLGQARYGRPELYIDTWRMAAEKPAFGWGLESYGPVFLRFSTFKPGSDGLMNTFEDAHSDWLQSLAEVGWVGTLLLVLMGLVPLAETWRKGGPPVFTGWLLAGCALIALFAWIEFPFACPAVVGAWWIFFFSGLRNWQLAPGPTESSSPGPPSGSCGTRADKFA